MYLLWNEPYPPALPLLSFQEDVVEVHDSVQLYVPPYPSGPEPLEESEVVSPPPDPSEPEPEPEPAESGDAAPAEAERVMAPATAAGAAIDDVTARASAAETAEGMTVEFDVEPGTGFGPTKSGG